MQPHIAGRAEEVRTDLTHLKECDEEAVRPRSFKQKCQRQKGDGYDAAGDDRHVKDDLSNPPAHSSLPNRFASSEHQRGYCATSSEF